MTYQNLVDLPKNSDEAQNKKIEGLSLNPKKNWIFSKISEKCTCKSNFTSENPSKFKQF